MSKGRLSTIPKKRIANSFRVEEKNLSAGLFQQVILQSGTGYCSLGFWDKQVARSITKELARLLNCSTESSEVMLRCFMGLDASALILGSEKLYVREVFFFNGEKHL